MEDADDQPIDKRAYAKQRLEKYLQQKKAHEELERLGLTSEQIESRINPQQQESYQKRDGNLQQKSQQANKQNGNTAESNKGEQRNQILTELTMKITERFQKEMAQDNKNMLKKKDDLKLESKISKEIENCTCPICFDLMVPPNNSPYLIFPCGHTFCQACLMPKDKLKVQTKCPLCRTPFKSYAVNIHLRSIICAYTDNKHLLEKYKDEIEGMDKSSANVQNKNKKPVQEEANVNGQSFEDNFKLSSLRCQILESEQNEILQNIQQSESQIATHQTVIDQLEKQRTIVQSKLSKLQQELSLIDDFIESNSQAVQDSKELVRQDYEKLELLNSTLHPLQAERQKYMILSQNQNNSSKK